MEWPEGMAVDARLVLVRNIAAVRLNRIWGAVIQGGKPAACDDRTDDAPVLNSKRLANSLQGHDTKYRSNEHTCHANNRSFTPCLQGNCLVGDC